LLHASDVLATVGTRSEGGEETHTTVVDIASLPAGVGLCLAPHVEWPNDDNDITTAEDDDALSSEADAL
jgi:hypothetical protein